MPNTRSLTTRLSLTGALLVALSIGGAPAGAQLTTLQDQVTRDRIGAGAITNPGIPAAVSHDQGLDLGSLMAMNKTFTELIALDPSIAKRPAAPTSAQEWKWKLSRFFGGTPSDEQLLAEGFKAFDSGDFRTAKDRFFEYMTRHPGDKSARYWAAVSMGGAGETDTAKMLADSLLKGAKEKQAADAKAAKEKAIAEALAAKEARFDKIFHEATDPWVRAGVRFKIGGFDSLDTYMKKVAAGNKMELHSDEYFEKYVDPKTWQYRSAAARREFESIAGIDCGGLVQRIYMQLCEKAGVKAPFNSKLPGSALRSPKYSKPVKDDGKIPPGGAKKGDVIFLTEHDGWGHFFLFDGYNKQGKPMIIEASGEGQVFARPMPDRYFPRYGGTFRFNDMDKIRDKLSKA